MKLKLVIGITVENRGLKTLKDGQAFVLSRKIALNYYIKITFRQATCIMEKLPSWM